MIKPQSTFRLFAYGTLKHGGCRHAALANQRFLGEFQTPPCYALFDLGGSPALVRREPGDVIHGEVYEVDSSRQDWLDTIESVPSYFKKELIDVVGLPSPVWAYFYQRDLAEEPRISSGHWSPETQPSTS